MDKKPTNRILYGTNLRGKQIRDEIQKRGNNEVAGIAGLLDLGKRLEKVSPSGFNPRKPNFTDWQKLLEIIAENYATQLSAKKDKIKPKKKVEKKREILPEKREEKKG